MEIGDWRATRDLNATFPKMGYRASRSQHS